MDTFLELPLDRDLYKPKKISKCDKPPLRVLITEAGTRIARHLMYKICSGEVFGPDQPVILHLVNARGCVNHRATLLDLEECGFPMLADSIVTAEPEKSYGKVDVVILICLFEELSGHNLYNSCLCQLNKIRIVAKNVILYGKPDTKVVVCSPSTKGVILLLACLKHFEPKLDSKHVTGVVCLDQTMAKALAATQVKTTTDKIKNVVIWGATVPDIHNATVLMYPPDDRAHLQKVEVPLMQALENHHWIYSEFVPKIYKRVLVSALLKHGAAVASATAKHLKLLYQGSDLVDDITSMAMIVPANEPYGVTKNIGFSFPVVSKNGEVTIRENIDSATTTHLTNLRSINNFNNAYLVQEVYKVIKYMKEYEEDAHREFLWSQHTYLTEKINYESHYLRYIISPRNDDSATLEEREVSSKKSITWENVQKSGSRNVRSILRFNV